ncbi:uncharacterized protein LOC119444736 [Dermacentor silvarum]|uniref:uncharacterized protein LOC119431827 n=1 Tax=Dermacentor silvarum TaxID=543639 RepID=UPI001897CA24|nr:uncharacterized protein LOC119431827 [Dermacentor silvarum]XP_037562221.1 uncharacterized protein LOC119441696 [Dermacentor silvarum]XP_037565016.1 uncharacterized protein LOC119444736 [Dermacentor silvarum]
MHSESYISPVKRSRKGSCCVVPGCSLRSGTNLLSKVRTFRFPVEADRRNAWIAAVRRDKWQPTKSSQICSAHFIQGQPSCDPNHPDYTPTVFPYRAQGNSGQKIARFQRAQRKRPFERADNVADSSSDPSTSTSDANGLCDSPKMCDGETQTELTTKDIAVLLQENEAMKQRLRDMEHSSEPAEKEEAINLPEITRTVVMQSDKTLKFYTGLVSATMFRALLQFVLSIWTPSNTTSLDAEQQLLLVLMRLRLGLLTNDLAYRFGISVGSVSVIFHSWLDVLATNFKKFIIWPSRLALQSHRLPAFEDTLFDNLRGIIDCTEIFIQRPTALEARSQTYSNYKHHNTVKVLVVISPSGSVTFVSKAWGGRASDKDITLRSGVLDMVEEGDCFLVDRGFRCEEMFAARGATILMPSLTKKRPQLSGGEVTTSRKLSRVRIHVERAIQRLKLFRSLQGVLPVSFVKRSSDMDCATIDKVLVVCSGLVNLQTPIINNLEKDITMDHEAA